MLTYESVVWLLFRSIDSCILIALATWLFIRKVLPILRNNISAERAKEAFLTQEVSALKQQADRLVQQLHDDTQEIEGLEQQVRLWQQAIKRKHNRTVAEKDDVMVRLRKQDLRRTDAVRKQKIYEQAVLEAVKQAEEKLSSSDVPKAAILEKCITYMSMCKESQ